MSWSRYSGSTASGNETSPHWALVGGLAKIDSRKPCVASARFRCAPGCPSGQRKQTVNLPANAYGGSNPSPGTQRPQRQTTQAPLAQSVERFHGKEEVFGSIPERGSGEATRPRRRSSVGESARLIIERSAVRVCPPLHDSRRVSSSAAETTRKGMSGDG